MSAGPDAPIRHYDPDQLLFQLHEVYERNAYVRHGIEVRAGDTVLDVGANVGVSATFFAQRGAAKVHAFEPIPALYELLDENLRPYPACVAHPYALGAQEGSATFSFYPRAAAMSSKHADPARDAAAVRTYMANAGYPGDERDPELTARFQPEQVACRVRPLSRVIEDEGIVGIDLLKIDVERSEHEVLAGLSPGDWKLVRQVVVEVHDVDGRCAEIGGLLREQGFSVVEEQEREWKDTELKMMYGIRDER